MKRLIRWLHRWRQAVARALPSSPPTVQGGVLSLPLPAVRRLASVGTITVRPFPLTLSVDTRTYRASKGIRVRGITSSISRPRVPAARGSSARCRSVALSQHVRMRRVAIAVATLPPSRRVLLSEARPRLVVRGAEGAAKIRARDVPLRWLFAVRQSSVVVEPPLARQSAVIWELPLVCKATPFMRMPPPLRERCAAALQKAAQGYARAYSVYYPVPAHAAASIEVDEGNQLLYIRLRDSKERARCVAVVWGKRLVDDQPVRAAVRVG